MVNPSVQPGTHTQNIPFHFISCLFIDTCFVFCDQPHIHKSGPTCNQTVFEFLYGRTIDTLQYGNERNTSRIHSVFASGFFERLLNEDACLVFRVCDMIGCIAFSRFRFMKKWSVRHWCWMRNCTRAIANEKDDLWWSYRVRHTYTQSTPIVTVSDGHDLFLIHSFDHLHQFFFFSFWHSLSLHSHRATLDLILIVEIVSCVGLSCVRPAKSTTTTKRDRFQC